MDFVGLLGQSVILGFAAAITPSLLALQILVVSGDPWRRRAVAVAAGGASAFVLVGVLLLMGFARLPTDTGDSGGPTGAWLRIAAGVALAVAAVALFRPHRGLEKRVQDDIEGYVGRASAWVFLGVAFLLSIKDLSSFIVLAPALHDIAVADVDVGEQALLLVVLYACALSPVLVPPALRLAFGHRIDAAFRAAYQYTMTHQFQLVGSMAAAIAAYLLVTGFTRLM